MTAQGKVGPVSCQRIGIIGKSGRLSQALQRQVWPQGLEPVFCGRKALDLLKPEQVLDRLSDLGVSQVINTAAYTDVDAAETNISAAFALNRDGAEALATACARLDLPLIHVSTDYVFGEGEGPRRETEPTNPLGHYGLSKRAGEQAVFHQHPRAQVVRTSWLFDGYSPSFLTTMLALRDRPQLDIISDQQGSPTLTDHLAKALIELVQKSDQSLPRLLHFANQGGASRLEMAREIFAMLDDAAPTPVLQPLRADQWPALAQRPADSRLSVELWMKVGLTPPPSWQDAVKEGVEQWRTTTSPNP